MRSAIAIMSAVLFASPPGALAQDRASCAVEARGWTLGEDGAVELVDVVVRCGATTLEAPTGSRSADTGRLTLRGDERSPACAAVASGGPTCCAAQAFEEADGAWLLEEVSCTQPDAGEVHASRVVVRDGRVELAGARVGAPLGLPGPSGLLDPGGRRAGFLPPVLGFEEGGRGAGLRQAYYLPVAPRASLELGLFGDSGGPAAGALADVAWAGQGRGRDNRLWLAGAWDGGAAEPARVALGGDGSVMTSDASAGVGLRGVLLSDAALATDWADLGLERLRSERRQHAAAWLGSDQDRLWIATHRRSFATPRGGGGGGGGDALVFRGALVDGGYAAGHDLSGLVSLDASLRAARVGQWGRGGVEAVDRMRALAGVDLRALQLPYLSLRPALWLDVGADFTDPEAGDVARRFDGRLLATATLSSTWAARGPRGQHVLEMAWDARLEPVREQQVDGADDVGLALEPRVGEPRHQTQVRFDQTFSRSDERGSTRWQVPVRWRYAGDSSLLLVGSDLRVDREAVRMSWEALAGVDTHGPNVAGAETALRLTFGRPAATHPAAPRVHLGAELRWVREGVAPAELRPLGTAPWLGDAAPAALAEEHLGVRGVVGFDAAWLGVDGELAWPLGTDGPYRAGGILSLGHRGDHRLVLGIWRGEDETYVALASFGVDFGGASGGPWSARPLAPASEPR